MDRFQLETDITSSWNTKDDIDLLIYHYENSIISNEELIETLKGISQVHEMRCRKIMDTFEKMIKNKKI